MGPTVNPKIAWVSPFENRFFFSFTTLVSFIFVPRKFNFEANGCNLNLVEACLVLLVFAHL